MPQTITPPERKRLDKLLADAGYGSRKQVSQLIRKGAVSVTGTICRDAATIITPLEQLNITVDGKPVSLTHDLVFMMNKPSGYVTAIEDKKHQTIGDLIPQIWQTRGLMPIGRLDIDTTGLLLLSNNGILNHHLTSPRHHMPKVYYLEIVGVPFNSSDISHFAKGVMIDHDKVCCRPANLEILDSFSALLTITEGKFHQVKKMMLATSRQVTKLKRIAIGTLQLDESLDEGEMRLLTEAERAMLN